MTHQHIYDSEGRQLCCTQTEKIYRYAGAVDLIADKKEKKEKHSHSHSHDHDHSHDSIEGSLTKIFIPPIVAFFLLSIGLILDFGVRPEWFTGYTRFIFYFIPYLIVGLSVIRDAIRAIGAGEIFSEFFLMTLATIGAFAIGEYPEGVAVMLFYAIGEVFQTLAVSKAKNNIKSLIDQRPDEVTVIDSGQPKEVHAHDVSIDSIVRLKPGEKVGLDGLLITERATFNTAALTGESKPDSKEKGDTVLAGMINLNTVSEIRVTSKYEDSKLSKILEMVQDASSRKAPTELFISKFAKIYTPIVVFLAVAIWSVPWFFVADYVSGDWLYRALIFLVISCPCALVISIPLGYFGGIGAASRNGILVKGSNFLDSMAAVNHVVMDKTGTITEGVFSVQKVAIKDNYYEDEILRLVNKIESFSTHPIATAIHEYVGTIDPTITLDNVEEIPGHGLKAVYKGQEFLAGNIKLLRKFGVKHDKEAEESKFTTIVLALNGLYVGYIIISDAIKEDAHSTIEKLHNLGIKTTMLSGDKTLTTREVAKTTGIQNAYGDLLPEDKVSKVEEIKSRGEVVAFVGDGFNDAPVIALSDVGIAMGGLGSDAAIEIADIVIQDDQPSKVPTAIAIGKETKKIVWQNISMAFLIKIAVLILGAGGIATMWEAIFADVGVSLLAIFNAMRIQRKKFN